MATFSERTETEDQDAFPAGIDAQAAAARATAEDEPPSMALRERGPPAISASRQDTAESCCIPDSREMRNRMGAVTDTAVTFMESMERRLDAMEKALKPIGFMAALNAGESKTATYRGGDNMKFTHVHVNNGNCYDAENYKFICPEEGLYQFSVSIRAADPDSEAWVEMVLKTGDLETVFGRVHINRIPHHEDAVGDVGLCGSSTFLKDLAVGDQVWVRAGRYGESHQLKFFVGLLEEAYTSFSGFRIG